MPVDSLEAWPRHAQQMGNARFRPSGAAAGILSALTRTSPSGFPRAETPFALLPFMALSVNCFPDGGPTSRVTSESVSALGPFGQLQPYASQAVQATDVTLEK